MNLLKAAPAPCPTRRRLALCWLASGMLPARAHDLLGPLSPPRPAPLLTLRLHTGEQRTLPALLQGRITAVQLMFTGCSATCPIQGAVFAALQTRITARLPEAQLLSISVDPLADDPAALAAWRQRFGALERWLAGAPPVRQSEVMLDFVYGRNRGTGADADRHRPQTWLFDRQGRLAFATAELASAGDIAQAMVDLARQR